jgi:transposase
LRAGERNPTQSYMREEPVVKDAIHYVGLDVHKETIAVALCDAQGRASSLGTIANSAEAVAKLMRRLQQKATLQVCYEAGACGYVLQRQLSRMGIQCIVVAPTLIPVKAGDRVKTDRRDALKLARYLRAGELVAVWVPDEAHEALRDLVRQREDAKADQKRAKNRLGKFLLRTGWQAPEGMKAWSRGHREWMQTLWMEEAAQRQVLRDGLAELAHQDERVARLDAAVLEQARTMPPAMRSVVEALVCLYGVQELTAVTVVAETGDLGRFAKAPQLFSYAGVVPSEHSSGGPDKTRRGGITKTGNRHLRRVLVESAWHYRRPPRVSAALSKRRAGKDPVVIEQANQAHRRLHQTYRRLIGAGKPAPRAVVAVGRELLGFMWAIARQVQGQAAAAQAGAKK